MVYEGEEGVDIEEAVVSGAKGTHHHNTNPSIHMPLDQETTSIDLTQGIIINISTILKIKMAIIVLIEGVEVVEVVEAPEIPEEKEEEEETWEDSSVIEVEVINIQTLILLNKSLIIFNLKSQHTTSPKKIQIKIHMIYKITGRNQQDSYQKVKQIESIKINIILSDSQRIEVVE